MQPGSILAVLTAVTGCLLSQPAQAAAELPGASMGWPWALPFIGILLSIATGPLLFAKIWHRHYGKIVAGWVVLTIAPIALVHGVPVALAAVVHAILADYLSFIVLLFTLYTVAGGILVSGTLRGSPLMNTAVLGVGTLMASIVGTTGAAMILVRRLILANVERTPKTHVIIFFIILVCNVGGALTPLGDPPLFAGFLRGVDFFWPARNMWMQTGLVVVLLLATFAALDFWHHHNDVLTPKNVPTARIRLHGVINIVLIGLVFVSILISAVWKPGVNFDLYGTKLELQNLVRDMSL